MIRRIGPLFSFLSRSKFNVDLGLNRERGKSEAVEQQVLLRQRRKKKSVASDSWNRSAKLRRGRQNKSKYTFISLLCCPRETRSTNSSRGGGGITFLSSRRHFFSALEFLPLILLSNNEANCNSPIATCSSLLASPRFPETTSVRSSDVELKFFFSPSSSSFLDRARGNLRTERREKHARASAVEFHFFVNRVRQLGREE